MLHELQSIVQLLFDAVDEWI